MTAYIKFEELKPNIKTRRFAIINLYGIRLGFIGWNGRWRQYCFYPEGDTVWSDGCLSDIEERLKSLNISHSSEKKEKED